MIRFECRLNAKSTKEINKFWFKKILWLIFTVSILLLVIGLCGFFCSENNNDRNLAIAYIILSVLIFPLTYFIIMIGQLFENRFSKSVYDGTDEIYEFGKDGLQLKQTSDKLYCQSDYKYSYFYKVYETKTHYILYISLRQCHIVPKNSIVEGTVDELNELLNRNLGKKFKSKR